RPRGLLADSPERDREPARDRPCRPRLARRTRDRPQGPRRDARRQPHVCAQVQGDVASGACRPSRSFSVSPSHSARADPMRALAFIGRHATKFMAAGVLAGFLAPPLAALAKPLLVPTLVIPLALALVRLDWSAMAAFRRRP